MSEKIVSLDGRKVNPEKPKRNRAIGELLSDVCARNDAGKLKGIAIVMIDQEDASLSAYRTSADVSHAVMVGAIEVLKYRVLDERQASWEAIKPED